MKLTAKQEAFCQALATGMSQADAYRAAYKSQAMKPETVQNSAYKLLKNGEISARVATLREELASKALWTREKSVLALSSVVEGSEAKGTEIVAAVKELNAMHGFLAPTKHEVDMKVAVNVHFD